MSRVLDPIEDKKHSHNPWFYVLILAPLPLLFIVLLTMMWKNQKEEVKRLKAEFSTMQNEVIRRDAEAVAHKMSELLSCVSHDLKSLQLMEPHSTVLKKFLSQSVHQVFSYEGLRSKSFKKPLYNFVSVLDSQTLKPTVQEGDMSWDECRLSELCNMSFLLKLKNSELNKPQIGPLMRFYRRKGDLPQEKRSHLLAGIKTSQHLIVVGLDYSHIYSLLFLPTFPYQVKSDLFKSYLEGNYIYLLDAKTQFLAHPKYWHISGVDSKTQTWATPVLNDCDLGKKPLRVSAYRGGVLSDYFGELNSYFMSQLSAVINAPNLTGTKRLVSVSPITLHESAGEHEVFGYVVSGCSVSHLHESVQMRGLLR